MEKEPTNLSPEDLLSLPKHMRGRLHYILLKGLGHPDLLIRKRDIPACNDATLDRLEDMGLIEKVGLGTWKINLDMVRMCSYVVPDEVFLKLSDPKYVYDMKVKMGLIANKQGLTYEQRKEKWDKSTVRRRNRKLEGRKRVKELGLDQNLEGLTEIFFPDKKE